MRKPRSSSARKRKRAPIQCRREDFRWAKSVGFQRTSNDPISIETGSTTASMFCNGLKVLLPTTRRFQPWRLGPMLSALVCRATRSPSGGRPCPALPPSHRYGPSSIVSASNMIQITLGLHRTDARSGIGDREQFSGRRIRRARFGWVRTLVLLSVSAKGWSAGR